MCIDACILKSILMNFCISFTLKPRLDLNLWSFCLSFPSSWGYRPVPISHLTLKLLNLNIIFLKLANSILSAETDIRQVGTWEWERPERQSVRQTDTWGTDECARHMSGGFRNACQGCQVMNIRYKQFLRCQFYVIFWEGSVRYREKLRGPATRMVHMRTHRQANTHTGKTRES